MTQQINNSFKKAVTPAVINGIVTMSSREIAELTGKKHGHVLRDIRAYIGAILQIEEGMEPRSLEWSEQRGMQVVGDTPVCGVTLSEETNWQNGQRYPVYLLDKSATLTIIAGYNIALRKRIIDRWQELEELSARPLVPQTLAEALRLAADMAEQNAALEDKVQQDAPKVAFVNHYVEAGGAKSLRETAKILNMPEKAMIDTLLRDKVLFRQSGNLLPHALRQREGLFTVKTGTSDYGHAYTQTRVTLRGVQWIAQRYASELMGG